MLRAVVTVALLWSLGVGTVPVAADSPGALGVPGLAPNASTDAGAEISTDPSAPGNRPISRTHSRPDAPIITDLYPNPPTDGDAGEFVTVEFPAGTDPGAYALADEHATVSLPDQENRVVVGKRSRITYSTESGHTSDLTDRRVRSLPDRIRLSNSGDRVRLLREGEVVDEIEYGNAPETEVYDVARGEWQPLGATEFPPVEATDGEIEAFVLPDESGRAVELLESADERIYLAGYTLSSRRVVEALTEANETGIAVEVLVDGSPVGGMSGRAAAALDELEGNGIEVRVIEGEYARYRFHHAKYAVVDGRALVTTENWKPSGTGGRASRGWGIITDQRPIVDGLAGTFHADSGWVDATPWSEFDDTTFVDSEPASGTYPTVFEAESFSVKRTELLFAPDNAEREITDAIRGAEQSLEIKQVRIGDEGFPLLQEAIEAAERGVEVRILLAGAWYVEDENERLESWLEERATTRNLPLDVRIAEPGGSFEKIHAKGMIVDGERTLVGSINWNNNSLRRNREAALLIESEGVAAYFRDVFEADWQDGDDEPGLPAGLLLAVLFVAVLAVLAASRLRFET